MSSMSDSLVKSELSGAIRRFVRKGLRHPGRGGSRSGNRERGRSRKRKFCRRVRGGGLERARAGRSEAGAREPLRMDSPAERVLAWPQKEALAREARRFLRRRRGHRRMVAARRMSGKGKELPTRTELEELEWRLFIAEGSLFPWKEVEKESDVRGHPVGGPDGGGAARGKAGGQRIREEGGPGVFPQGLAQVGEDLSEIVAGGQFLVRKAGGGAEVDEPGKAVRLVGCPVFVKGPHDLGGGGGKVLLMKEEEKGEEMGGGEGDRNTIDREIAFAEVEAEAGEDIGGGRREEGLGVCDERGVARRRGLVAIGIPAADLDEGYVDEVDAGLVRGEFFAIELVGEACFREEEGGIEAWIVVGRGDQDMADGVLGAGEEGHAGEEEGGHGLASAGDGGDDAGGGVIGEAPEFGQEEVGEEGVVLAGGDIFEEGAFGRGDAMDVGLAECEAAARVEAAPEHFHGKVAPRGGGPRFFGGEELSNDGVPARGGGDGHNPGRHHGRVLPGQCVDGLREHSGRHANQSEKDDLFGDGGRKRCRCGRR